MIRASSRVVLALACLAVASGCDKFMKKKSDESAPSTAASGGGAGGGSGGAGGTTVGGGGGAGCTLPEDTIRKDTTLKKGCVVAVKNHITLDEGATLTIEPGVKLEFDSDIYVWNTYGRIVAKGTDKEPIVFTSKNKSPGAGDWGCIYFDDKAMAGNIIDYAVIEFSGRKSHNCEGAINIANAVQPGRVAITNTIFRKNGQAGVVNVGESSTFAKFEGNTMSANDGTSMRTLARHFGSVSGNNKFGEPVHLAGDVHASVAWPKVDVPIIVDTPIWVQGEKNAAILTIAEKNVVKFAIDSVIGVGGGQGGGLVAKNVTFTSANATTEVGDWAGLIFDQKTTGSILENCTIEFAGRDSHNGQGAITFLNEAHAKNVKITGTTVRKSKSAGVFSYSKECKEIEAGVKAEGVPACKQPD